MSYFTLREALASQHAAELALRTATAAVQAGRHVISDGAILQSGSVFSIDPLNKTKLSASGDAA